MNPLDALTLLPASVPFFLNLYNARHWPRADEVPATVAPKVSVLIPARNEEANVERCVRAALASVPPVHEVVVCDDASTDATPAILARLVAEDARVRIIGGDGELPEGWVGKPWATARLGEAATGDLLVFVDADTALTPDGVARAWGVLDRLRGRVLSAVPHQEAVGFTERLMLPLLVLTYTSWVPLDLVWKHVDPRLLVANGQVMAFRRQAYERIGGFAAVKGEIVDDMAIARRAKELDERVVFCDGEAVATTRMYRTPRELWDGFSKNLYQGLGEQPLALLFVMATYATAFVLPYARAAVEVVALGAPSAAALAGIALNVGARAILARRHGHTALSVALHPLAVVGFLAIALNSALWTLRGTVRWRGRTYGRRTSRAA